MPGFASHCLQFSVPPNTSEYQYQDKQHFHNVLHKEKQHSVEETGRSQYIIFFDIDKHRFLKEFSDTINIDSYIPGSRLLLVKMITRAHEGGHINFDDLLKSKLAAMNLRGKLLSLGRADVETENRQKEPDQSYLPSRLPPGRTDKWPTMIIEGGYSEEKAKLTADVQWWLAESQGDVTMAIAISVHKAKKEITIELWGMMARPTRTEPAKKVPEIRHRVVISQGTSQQTINVARAPLTISFHDLFLRPAGPNEGDLVFSKEDFEEIASAVWQVHEKV